MAHHGKNTNSIRLRQIMPPGILPDTLPDFHASQVLRCEPGCYRFNRELNGDVLSQFGVVQIRIDFD